MLPNNTIESEKAAPPSFSLRLLHYPYLGLMVSLLVILKLIVSAYINLNKDVHLPTLYHDFGNLLSSDEFVDAQVTRAEFLNNSNIIVFSAKKKEGRSFELYLKDLDSNIIHQLTDDDIDYWAVTVSPVTNRIAYVKSESNQSCGIYIAKLSSQNTLEEIENILSCERQSTRDLDWSHDEASLYFTAKSKIVKGSPLLNKYRQYAAYQYHLSSNRVTQLFSLGEPEAHEYLLSASSDGKWLVYVKQTKATKSSYFLYDLTSGEQRLLVKTGYHTNGLSWSPDNQKLIVSTSVGPMSLSLNGEMWNLVSNNKHKFSFSSTNYSTDMNYLVSEITSWKSELWQAENPLNDLAKDDKDFSSTKLQNKIMAGPYDYAPVYANNSNQIIFMTYRNFRIEIKLRKENGEEVLLTDGTPYDFSLTHLQWSKDDSQIMFTANQGIYLLTLKSGLITRLTDKQMNAEAPSWSNDGKYIYFSSDMSGTAQIWRVNIDGDELQQMTINGGSGAKDSIDGTMLYFYKKHEPGLWAKKLVLRANDIDDNAIDLTQSEYLLIDDFSIYAFRSWQVFKNGIYYHSFTNNLSRINFWDFEDSKSIGLIDKNKSDINCSYFSVAKDQSNIVIQKNTYSNQLRLFKRAVKMTN
ncbi:TolB family protein [Aliikangiella sp. IMCC44359]|uniref:TolB family protein n=1 Tax=Aliikangiella sp. IMCC44359 TaxID=3459125 RepID=UPI00403A9C77